MFYRYAFYVTRLMKLSGGHFNKTVNGSNYPLYSKVHIDDRQRSTQTVGRPKKANTEKHYSENFPVYV